jgi:hypothetical protein
MKQAIKVQAFLADLHLFRLMTCTVAARAAFFCLVPVAVTHTPGLDPA